MIKKYILLAIMGGFLFSCSDLPEYELPYDLSAVSQVTMDASATTANTICSGPVATFNADSEETTIYYLLVRTEGDYSSDDIFNEGDDVYLPNGGSVDVPLGSLEPGSTYYIYSVSVNTDGTRSDQVFETSFTTPDNSAILADSFSGNYSGQALIGSDLYSEFTPTLTANDDGTFSVDSFFGDFVANATGVADYVGAFQYPGTLEINDDFSVTVTTENGYATGGTGTYDPCTDTFNLTLDQFIFTNEDGTSQFDVNVVFSPAE